MVLRRDWRLYVQRHVHQEWTHSRPGKGGDVSVALKHQVGDCLFAASAHVGYGTYDTDHRISIGARRWGLNADQQLWTAGLRLRAAYQFSLNGFCIRPYVDLYAVHTYAPGFASVGNFMHAYSFGAMKKWTFTASPTIEIGARVNLGENMWLCPYASVGATVLNDPAFTSHERLEANGAPFTSTHRMDKGLADLGVGAKLFANDVRELRAEYKARLGENYTRHEAVGRMASRF